jgi:uncharacterized protein YcnI
MKKIVTLSMLFLMALSGQAFAEALADDTATTTDGLQIYGGVDAADAAANTSVLLGKMSKGVNFKHNSATTGFAAATKHISGSKTYGTAHNSTAIYFQDVGTGGAIPALSDANNDSFGGGGWTTM